MILRTSISPLHPGQEAGPSSPVALLTATQRVVRPAGKPHEPEGHSYLRGHFLEVAPSPSDDVAQEEDGAVGMLRAVAAGLQVGLIVSCQHIHPAHREEGNPTCLPLCLPAQAYATKTAETRDFSNTPHAQQKWHLATSLDTLRASPLLAQGKQAAPAKMTSRPGRD